jgi:hypothetical protein
VAPVSDNGSAVTVGSRWYAAIRYVVSLKALSPNAVVALKDVPGVVA